MAYWRTELWYRTKRGGVALGMTVKADDEEEAQQIAEDRHLRKYPARKFVKCIISPATPHNMKMGVINETRK